MALFGGDDVSAIVIDIGTHSTKAGYAGEDTPRCVIPTSVGFISSNKDVQQPGAGPMEVDGAAPAAEADDRTYYVGPKAQMRRDFMNMTNPIQHGLIHEWNVVEKIWEHIFNEAFAMNPKEHPVLLAESSYNTPALREKATEILFEKFEVPALFLAKNAVLSAFASGKANALVVEAGAGMTLATPVHDGYVLQKSIVRSTLAGNELTSILHSILTDNSVNIRPSYSFTKKLVAEDEWQVTDKDFPNTTPSFREFACRNIVDDIKASYCKAAMTYNQSELDKRVDDGYQLPDGTQIYLGAQRFRLAEFLFRPESIPNKYNSGGQSRQGLSRMVHDAISSCDNDLRKELYRNIVLSGGSSLFPTLNERLTQDLMELAPTQLKKDVKVVAAPAVERKFSVFIGGSILGSLGTFHQMWMSKGEYEEHGKALVDRKCP